MKELIKGLIWPFLVILIGLFCAYFENHFVTEAFRPMSLSLLDMDHNKELKRFYTPIKKEYRKVDGRGYDALWIEGERVDVPFRIESPESLRLKIQGYFPSSGGKGGVFTLFVNGAPFRVLPVSWKGDEEVFRLKIPEELLVSGRNVLGFSVSGHDGALAGISTLKVRNYLGKSSNFPRGFVLYDDSYERLGLSPSGRYVYYLLFPLALVLLWFISIRLMDPVDEYDPSVRFRKVFYFSLPGALVAALSLVYTLATPYTVVTSSGTFGTLVFGPYITVIAYRLVKRNYSHIKAVPESMKEVLSELRSPGAFVRGSVEDRAVPPPFNIIGRLGTLAIFCFSALIVAAGVLMILKRQALAERCADISYFVLLFGILMRIIDVRRMQDG